ncbi:MAG: hypothetical protein QXF22_02645, partial [Thermoplasmata archaeon]
TNPMSYYFDSLWEYVAINVNTTYMGFLPPVAGVFVSQLDNKTPDPVLASWLGVTTNTTAWDYVYYGYGIMLNNSYVVNGTGSYYVTVGDAGSPMVDRISNVYVIPYAYTYYPQTPGIYPPGVIVNGNFYMQGSEYISSQLAVQRAPDYRITTFTVNNPFGFSAGQITAQAKVVNATDQPVNHTKVWFYSKTGIPSIKYIVNNIPTYYTGVNSTTDVNGSANVTIPLSKVASLTIADLYIYWNKGTSVWGMAAITQNTQIILVPYQINVFATASTNSVMYGSLVTLNVNVKDATGSPIPGALLSVSASAGSIIGPNKADSSGNAVYTVIPANSTVMNTPYIIDTITIKSTMTGYYGGLYTFVIIAYSSSPTVSVNSLLPNQVITTSNYYVNGTVWDPAGIKSVKLYLNNPSNVYNASLIAGPNGEYTFSNLISGFNSGLNAVFVSVTNNNNVTTILPVFFYYQPVTYVSSGYFNNTLSSKLGGLSTQFNNTLTGYFNNTMGYSSLLIGLLAFIIAIVALVLSMRKPKPPEVKKTPEEKTSEEKKEGGETPPQ